MWICFAPPTVDLLRTTYSGFASHPLYRRLASPHLQWISFAPSCRGLASLIPMVGEAQNKQMSVRLQRTFIFDISPLSKASFARSLKQKCQPMAGHLFVLAESEGFEPPDLLQSTVFKTAAIDHSASSPRQK